jgi:L-malate glycosyltransferase
MINILEVDNSKGWGGQEIRTQRLVNGMNQKKFNVYFAAQPDSGYMKRKSVIKATFLPLKIRKGYDVIALFRLCYFIWKYKIDIVATHSGWDGWLGAIAAKITRCKVVRTRHLQTPITNKFSYNISDKVVTDSHFVKKALKEQGVKGEKIVTIHTGVNIREFNPHVKPQLRQELKLDQEAILIGMSAVFRYAKRHDLLVEAVHKLQKLYPHLPLYLVFIGTGPQKKVVEKQVKLLKMKEERVVFLGHRKGIPYLLVDLDICVLPSEMEALGTAIIEASACSVPIVGSSAGGIPEVVLHGKTGMVFESGNVEDLVEKLKFLIFDPEKRKEMGEQARIHAENMFSVEKMVKETEKLYKKII